MYDIETMRDIWDFYGGAAALAKRCRLERTAVVNWQSRGIPSGWQMRMIMDLIEAGKTFNPSLFDLEDHPGADITNREIVSRRENTPAQS